MECLGQPTGGFSGCLELLELRSEFGVELCTVVYAKLLYKNARCQSGLRDHRGG